MKSITTNAPRTKTLNTREFILEATRTCQTLYGRFAVMTNVPRVPDFRERDLLDKNLGPEIRRSRV